VVYSTPWLALTTTVDKTFNDGTLITSCTFKLPRGQYLSYFLADLFLFYVIPLVINCILYGLIGVALYSSPTVSPQAQSRHSPLATDTVLSYQRAQLTSHGRCHAVKTLVMRNKAGVSKRIETAAVLRRSPGVSSRVQV